MVRKTNEIAGIGNHNTAEFWEYDTRLGRRWNVDPVDQISISNYAVNSNSQIMMNDPDGDVTGDYYSTEGKYLGKDERNDNKVYTTSQGNYDYMTGVTSNSKLDYDGLREFSKKLDISHSEFITKASTVYGESSFSYKEVSEYNLKMEMFSLASVHKNYPNEAAFGKDSKGAVAFRGTSPNKRNGTKMQISIAAQINAQIGGPDYSNGARYWDGRDQAMFDISNDKVRDIYGYNSKGEALTAQLHMNTRGWSISDSHYKKWKAGVGSMFKAPQEKYSPIGVNKGFITYESTSVWGATIFWKDTKKSKPQNK